MKTSGKSPAELQKEVNKKCKYSFCQGCAGGGGREGIPCCTPNCEVVEEEKAPLKHFRDEREAPVLEKPSRHSPSQWHGSLWLRMRFQVVTFSGRTAISYLSRVWQLSSCKGIGGV
eukprot:1982214-Amphidinium_carterae.1